MRLVGTLNIHLSNSSWKASVSSFILELSLKAEYYKICNIHHRTDAWAAEQFSSNVGEKKTDKIRVSQICLYYVHFRHFCHCIMKTTRDLSRRKIESVFGHFTKFNVRKTDFSQNSMYRHESFLFFLGIPLFKAFQIATFSNFCAK